MEIVRSGSVAVTAILDVAGELPLADVFGDGTVPGGHSLPVPVDQLGQRHPDEFTDRTWLLRCRCFLVQFGARTILVDAGIGPADSPFGRYLGCAGRLPDTLAELGLGPADIDDVVLTHHHSDHTGWCTDIREGVPVARFPNAQYHLHPADLAVAEQARDIDEDAVYGTVFMPLLRTGQLRTDPGDYEVTAGLRLHHTPGHTPGHRCVLLTMPDDKVVFAGDLVHFALQLTQPQFSPRYDSDPAAAAASRTALLHWARRDGWRLAATHLPAAFTDLR